MASTTPNKETVRRICILNGAKNCYIIVDSEDSVVEVFADVGNDKMNSFLDDLESWCGMKFKVFNTATKKEKIREFKKNGEHILPIKIEE